MKKTYFTIAFLLASLILLSSIATAQEIATQEDVLNAGITPDSPFLYALDIALESIEELFSENSKLVHAKERLSEVKVMLQENKVSDAEFARKNFEKIRQRIKNQTEIEEHAKLMDNLGLKISQIASVRGALNETQRQDIKNLIGVHKDRIRDESIQIESKIGRSRGTR